TYANNNPITLTDPTGTRPDGACGGSSSQCNGKTETFTKTANGGWEWDGGDPVDTTPTANDIASQSNLENSALYDISHQVHKKYGGKSDVTRWMEAFWARYGARSTAHESGESNAITAYGDAMAVCNDLGCSDDLRNYFWDSMLTGVATEYGISDGGGMGGAPALTRSMKIGKATGGRSSSGSSSCKCFLAGTEVLMADGTSKNIEDVNVGDEVVTTDPETGKSGKRKVTHLIVTEDDKHFNELAVGGANGKAKLTATYEHPFWSPSVQKWIAARDLTEGTTLLTDDQTTVTVESNRAFSHYARTYNLTIEDFHTYYVLAGQTPVLVHNSTPACDLTKPGPYAVESIPARSQSQRFTQAEKDAINRIGDWFGCHSCGASSPGRPNWTPDHQPVSRFVLPGAPQRLYPHCMTCSSRQGGLVGHMPAKKGVPHVP
ncbi:polymorphic toxin-type HINT domain-containing protein, partial [Streptomyces sp. NPDC049951]